MVEGRTESLDQIGWNHVSSLMAQISNIRLWFDKNAKAVHPADLNPYYAPKDDGGPLKLPFTVLRDMFVGPQNEVTLTKRE